MTKKKVPTKPGTVVVVNNDSLILSIEGYWLDSRANDEWSWEDLCSNEIPKVIWEPEA